MENRITGEMTERVKVVDATLRDGGIVNNFYFPAGFAAALYAANLAAGVDIMEFGYKVSKKLFDVTKFGEWKFCDEYSLRAVVGENNTRMKISVMSDVGRVDLKTEVLPKDKSVIDIYRIATYVSQADEASQMINYCHDMGYQTCCNIMAISRESEEDLLAALGKIARTSADVIYIVDSFGSLYPDEMAHLCDMYGEIAYKHGKKLGIHAHNNQQLAFANTIACIDKGVTYLDATVGGMGRGAGNCALEALIGYLRTPRYDINPILQFIREHLNPVKRSGVEWGYDVPYLLTGLNGVHPYAAIDFMKDGREDYERFLAEITKKA